MFGVQWDLVLRYLETKGVTQTLLNSDSTSWGNYFNAEFDVTNSNAKYAIGSQSSLTLGDWNLIPTGYKKPGSGTENYVLLTTGANETRNSKMNICDLAGNVWEWTLEYTSLLYAPCANRGSDDGVDPNDPASYRAYGDTTSSTSYIGFRVALY